LAICSAPYSWTYIVLQIPSGRLLDRFGVQRLGRVSTFLWSVASFLAGGAQGFGGLVSARLLLGVAEAPTFPGNVKAISGWFPREQRGLPMAIFDAAAKFASAIGIPVVAVVVHNWGMAHEFRRYGIGEPRLLRAVLVRLPRSRERIHGRRASQELARRP